MTERATCYLPWMLIFSGLYFTARMNYLLFHSLAEVFSVVIACGIFMVAWNCRKVMDNHYLLFLGIAYPFVGGMDLIHTFSYKGMGVFPTHRANLPTQLWVAARYLESLSLLVAPVFLKRNLRTGLVFSTYCLIAGILAGLIFMGIFPICFAEDAGLSRFKIVSEYVICLILLAAIAFLLKNRHEFERKVLHLLVLSIAFTIGSEVAFTLYRDVYGISNMVGHFLKIFSFYLIYEAVIKTGLVRPRDLLFRNLKRREEELETYAERMKMLHRIDRAILEIGSPAEVARAAVSHLRNMLPCEGTCALLFDFKNKKTRPLAIDSDIIPPLYSDGRLAFRCDKFMGKLDAGRTVLLDKRLHKTALCPVQQGMADAGIHSFIAAPLRDNGELVGAFCVFAREKGRFTDEHLDIVREVALPVAIALQNARLLEDLSLHRRQLRDLSLKLTEVEENERHRIARELHDEIGQNLTALGINLNILRNSISGDMPPETASRLADSLELVKKMSEQIRDVMYDLRPPVLDDYGLAAALRWYADKISARTGVPVILEDGDVPRLSPLHETALFRIAQEAVINAVKHSGAGRITIRLHARESMFELMVIDDGAGFDPGRAHALAAEGKWGLVTMRERTEAMGGRFRIESAPGQGTKIIAEVPR